jgi:hypothetical protein
VNTLGGEVAHPAVAEALGLSHRPLEVALAG